MKAIIFNILSLFFGCILILSACNQDYLEEHENFSRLYKGPEAIEAIDFVRKPDGSGYLILGNSRRIIDGTPNSNLIIFDVDKSGFTRNTNEIENDFIDNGKKLFINDNQVVVLGIRETDEQINTIVLATDLDGNSILNNDTASIRELKYESNGISLIMEDLFIANGDVLLSGYIENSAGATKKISRVYPLSTLLNFDIDVVDHVNQFPIINSETAFDNSKATHILTSPNRSGIYIVGQEYLGESNPSLNISIDQINDLRSSKPEISPSINYSGNQILTACTFGILPGDIYFGGKFEKTENNAPDSLFVIRGTYFENSTNDQLDIIAREPRIETDFGNELTDLIQLSNGEILAVTSVSDISNNEEVGRSSYILKYSFSADQSPRDELSLEYLGNGFYDIKKIIEEDGKLIILSQIEFGTGETAIELSKVLF
ncbi:hypothetical protein GCM10027429_23360 [Marivirga atlantica]